MYGRDRSARRPKMATAVKPMKCDPVSESGETLRSFASRMVHLAQAVDPELINLSPQQVAALQLAQALKAGYTNPHAQ